MATKTATERRLFVLGGDIVVLIGDEIVETIDVDEEELKEEITRQISRKAEDEKDKRPIVIFSKALENIIGIKFKPFTYKMYRENQKPITVHESYKFREYSKFIMEKLKFEEQQKRIKQTEKKRRIDSMLDSYFSGRVVSRM